MNAVFIQIKDLIPIPLNIKTRGNGEFLTVCSPKLDIFHLNSVAKDFYLLLDEKKTVASICTELSAMYEVEFDTLTNDIVNLVRDMQWQTILNLKSIG
jgi:hypothetical protein